MPEAWSEAQGTDHPMTAGANMVKDLRPERWFSGAVTTLTGSWFVMIICWASETSPGTNGAMVFVAFALAILFFVLKNRAQRPQREHWIVYWLVPATTVVAVASIDYQGMRTEGIVLNTTPVVVLILALLRRT